jgi:hypothetical protein
VRKTVDDAGGRVCFVRLLVSEAEQERRVDSASRREFHKLTDVNVLRRSRSAGIVVEQPPADLEIDTDVSNPAATAERIVNFFGLNRQAPVRRYPA